MHPSFHHHSRQPSRHWIAVDNEFPPPHQQQQPQRGDQFQPIDFGVRSPVSYVTPQRILPERNHRMPIVPLAPPRRLQLAPSRRNNGGGSGCSDDIPDIPLTVFFSLASPTSGLTKKIFLPMLEDEETSSSTSDSDSDVPPVCLNFKRRRLNSAAVVPSPSHRGQVTMI